MTEFCELQQDVVGLASGSTTAMGPGVCVHGLKLPWPGSRNLELWNSLPIAQVGHRAHKHLPLMGAPELCVYMADFLSGHFWATCVVADSVGRDHHEFLCFRSFSQDPTNVRSIPLKVLLMSWRLVLKWENVQLFYFYPMNWPTYENICIFKHGVAWRTATSNVHPPKKIPRRYWKEE